MMRPDTFRDQLEASVRIARREAGRELRRAVWRGETALAQLWHASMRAEEEGIADPREISRRVKSIAHALIAAAEEYERGRI